MYLKTTYTCIRRHIVIATKYLGGIVESIAYYLNDLHAQTATHRLDKIVTPARNRLRVLFERHDLYIALLDKLLYDFVRFPAKTHEVYLQSGKLHFKISERLQQESKSVVAVSFISTYKACLRDTKFESSKQQQQKLPDK